MKMEMKQEGGEKADIFKIIETLNVGSLCLDDLKPDAVSFRHPLAIRVILFEVGHFFFFFFFWGRIVSFFFASGRCERRTHACF